MGDAFAGRKAAADTVITAGAGSQPRSLPTDFLQSAARNVRIASLAIGSLWVIGFFVNDVVWPLSRGVDRCRRDGRSVSCHSSVAGKLIRPEILERRSPERARIMVERFRREAEAAANLRSPHTIGLYDFGVSDRGLAARLAPLFGHDLADQPPITGPQLRAMRAADLTPRLRELQGVPTLVVNGAYDPIAPPRLGRVLAGGIPGARYVEFPDASHGLPIQFPGRVNALLLEHFRAANA